MIPGASSRLNAKPRGEATHVPRRTIHLWLLRPTLTQADLTDQLRTLPENERSRAQRFRSNTHARQWVASRLSLRRILAAYSGFAADALIIETNCRWCGHLYHGKPRLREEPSLSFSLAHTRGLLAVAITETSDVGVDLEAMSPNLRALAWDVCAPSEMAWLMSEPDTDRALVRVWVRKEAVSKAVGLGLVMPLPQVRLSGLTRRQEIAVANGQAWWVREWQLGPDLYCAVGSSEPIEEMRVFQVDDALSESAIHRELLLPLRAVIAKDQCLQP